jgi:hypothetical protein
VDIQDTLERVVTLVVAATQEQVEQVDIQVLVPMDKVDIQA